MFWHQHWYWIVLAERSNVWTSSLTWLCLQICLLKNESHTWKKNKVLFDKVISFLSITIINAIPSVGLLCRYEAWANYCCHLYFVSGSFVFLCSPCFSVHKRVTTICGFAHSSLSWQQQQQKQIVLPYRVELSLSGICCVFVCETFP